MGILDKLRQAKDNANADSPEDQALEKADESLGDGTGNKISSRIDEGENQAKQVTDQNPQARDPSTQVSPTDDTIEQPLAR